MKKQQTYGNDSISALKGADRVRKRPAVIFGSDGLDGCEHAVFEILSNAIDEAREGHGKVITLTHYADGSIEVEDNLCATVKYRNGSFGTIEVSTSCAPGFPRRLEFSGSAGTVAFEEDKITRWEFAQSRPEDEAIKRELSGQADAKGGSAPMNISSDGHACQISDLADAVLSGRKPFLDGHEGRRANPRRPENPISSKGEP